MNSKVCECAFYKCVDRGLKPANHALSCPMFKQETNICKEEWLHEGDKERFLQTRENIRNGIKKSRSRAKKQNDT